VGVGFVVAIAASFAAGAVSFGGEGDEPRVEVQTPATSTNRPVSTLAVTAPLPTLTLEEAIAEHEALIAPFVDR
jgi:hypothetical protein